MKVLQINTVYAEGSTGMIAKNIHDACAEHQIECLSAHRFIKKGSTSPEDSIGISTEWDSRIHGWWSRFTMFKGTGSVFRTMLFLKKVAHYAPDIIHLHNLHGSYVNLPLLFWFIKKHRIPVVWTLHDCWAFTAICSHFALTECEHWKGECHHCPQKKRFSSAPMDLSRQVWRAKKSWFTGMQSATIVTPSRWLEHLVKQSFLKEYSVVTIQNGIDLHTFTPTTTDFRTTYRIEDKKIVLGVSFDWSYEKGVDVFISLAERLNDEYQIVLVGTNDDVDKHLPDYILSIHRTHDQIELAKLYSTADVFVNPTREDTFPTVNIEALACGTPVVTFRTGGSPESIDETCGVVVEQEDIETMEKEIVRICTQTPFSAEACTKRAALFDRRRQIKNYIQLYKSIG